MSDTAVIVEAVYQEYNPQKLADPNFLGNTLQRYEGREAELIQKLMRKYEVRDPEGFQARALQQRQ